MPLYIGSRQPADYKLGAQDVQRLYLGSSLVWERSGVITPSPVRFDTFDAGIADWSAEWDPAMLSNPPGVLRYRNNGSSYDSLSWQVSNAFGDVEILAKLRTVGSTRPFGVTARVGGPSGARVGYVARDNGFNNFGILKIGIGGVADPPSGEGFSSTPFSQTADAWHWIRFRCFLGALRAKVWIALNPEPAEWMVFSSDTSVGTVGKVGLTNEQSFNDQECDYFAVSTDGSTIPVPT